MRISKRRILQSILSLGLLAMPSMANATGGTSDAFAGVWSVTITPDDSSTQAGKQEFADMMLFDGSQVMASACASYGFAPAEYSLTNGGSSFSATMSTDSESIAISGNCANGSMSGQVVWTKPDGSVFHYTMSGQMQQQQQQQQQDQQQESGSQN